jgi:hypothetical protein
VRRAHRWPGAVQRRSLERSAWLDLRSGNCRGHRLSLFVKNFFSIIRFT